MRIAAEMLTISMIRLRISVKIFSFLLILLILCFI